MGGVFRSYAERARGEGRRGKGARGRVRLVKGAYDEQETVAYPRKVDVDAHYAEAMREL